jgi:hypothetical protein
MAYTNLITTEWVYNNTIIDSNVDSTLIEKFIRESQDIHIQQAIGWSMYQIYMNSGGIQSNLTAAYYDLLINYIQKCQGHYVVYGILPYLNYHLTNKSVNTKSSDYSQPSGLKELEYLRNDAKSKAEFYVARIREQIVNNPGDFPQYWETSGIDRINPKAKNYTSMIWLPQTTRIPYGAGLSNDGQFGYPCN